MSLLEVNNLSVCFHNPGRPDFYAVKGISFSLEKGEIFGIVGESGSGKSLSALSILGLLPYPKASHPICSSIRFNGTELLDNPNLSQFRGSKIGFVFQEPMSSLNPLHTIEHQIAETLILHQNMSARRARREVLRLLKLTGIKNARSRMQAYPHELSGGQRQRVMIAMAIANHPDILIADEPTTALDVTIQEQIIELLLKLRRQLGMAIIFISHDLRLMRRIADRVAVMKSGKIIEQGSCRQIFEHPQESYTKKLINSHNILNNIDNKESNIIAEIKNICVRYPVRKNFWGRVTEWLHAVDNVSLELRSGQTLGIVGESGSGKTTLGQVLCRLLPFAGSLSLHNLSAEQIPLKEWHKQVQIVFQDPYNSLNPRMNIGQIVGEGLEVHFPRLTKAEKKRRIVQALQEVGLPQTSLERYPHEFSGGQRQRIAIARALILEPQLLVLDEPTSALDVTIQAQILKLLRQIQQQRKLSYLFISHNMQAIQAISDEVAVMKDGRIIEQGSCRQIFEHPREEYTKLLIKASAL